MKKQWLLVSLIMLGIGPVGSRARAETSTNEVDEADEREWTVEELTVIHERGVKLLRQTNHGRFVLAGGVVDQDGKPLAEVSLRVGMSQMAGWGWNPSKDLIDEVRNSALRDGSFKVSVSPYYDVSLHFEKEGYYPEERYYRFDYKPEDEAEREERARAEERILRGEEVTVKEGVVRHENIRVVMGKILPYAKLTDYSATLENRITDYGPIAGTAIDFNRSITNQKHVVRISDLSDTNQWPQRGVMMNAEISPEGTIAFVVKHNPPYADDVVPIRVRVRMLNPEDGFLPYGGTNWLWETEVPTNGYRNELDLDAETMWKEKNHGMELDPRSLPIFCRAAGKYGKGKISVGDVDRKRTGVKVFLDLEIQPDGSRYIHTPVRRF